MKKIKVNCKINSFYFISPVFIFPLDRSFDVLKKPKQPPALRAAGRLSDMLNGGDEVYANCMVIDQVRHCWCHKADLPSFQSLSAWEGYSALLCSSASFNPCAAPGWPQWNLIMWAFNWGPSFRAQHTLPTKAHHEGGLLTLPDDSRVRALQWDQNRKWSLGV